MNCEIRQRLMSGNQYQKLIKAKSIGKVLIEESNMHLSETELSFTLFEEE
jgi:hypothetical protein